MGLLVQHEAEGAVVDVEGLDAGDEFLEGGVGFDIGGDEIEAFDVADPAVGQGDAAEAEVIELQGELVSRGEAGAEGEAEADFLIGHDREIRRGGKDDGGGDLAFGKLDLDALAELLLGEVGVYLALTDDDGAIGLVRGDGGGVVEGLELVVEGGLLGGGEADRLHGGGVEGVLDPEGAGGGGNARAAEDDGEGDKDDFLGGARARSGGGRCGFRDGLHDGGLDAFRRKVFIHEKKCQLQVPPQFVRH